MNELTNSASNLKPEAQPGPTRTDISRFWRALLYQLSYRRTNQYTIPCTVCNNEHTGFSDITRKRLLSLVSHDILWLVVTFKKRGGIDDSNHGRSAHSGGRSAYSPDNAVYSQKIHQSRQTGRRHGSRSLACSARSSEKVCREPDQTGNRPEINKATYPWWQTTIETFTAVRLFLKLETLKEQPLYDPAYFLVYGPCNAKSRCRYTRVWARGKKVCS